jgi:uncharacterized membrane protein HdeD (DUF308 family)
MDSKTYQQIMGIIAIIVGIIFIVDPAIVAYLLGIVLIAYGLMELINIGMK